MRCEKIISVRASAIGMASVSLFVPANARTTHSAIKHEMTTEMISQRASVVRLGASVVGIIKEYFSRKGAKAQRKAQSSRCFFAALLCAFAPLREKSNFRFPSPQN